MNEFLTALDAHREASIALSFNGARFIPGDDTLIVTFQPFAETDDPEEFSPQAVWAEEFLRKRGFSVLGINRQRNNWYRAPDLHALLRALQQRGFFSRYRRVMFYGGSMGGFAALTFASLAPGCTVLAHNPQSTLRGSDTPWETRFKVAQAQDWEGDFSDGAIGARSAARVYVSYDPFDTGDRRHVARLDPSNLVPLRVPMVGHLMPIWLLQMKLLGTVFDMSLDGSLSVPRFRQMVRARFELPHYLISLAHRTRNPDLQQYLGEKARGLAPQMPGPRDYLWSLAQRRAAAKPQGIAPLLIWTVDGCRANDVMAWIQQLRPDAITATEPFSGRCKPHDLSALQKRLSHIPMVRDEIQRLLSGSQVLLHRMAAGVTRFELLLLEGARALGFNHVLLHRRDAFARCAEAAGEALPATPGDVVKPPLEQARMALTALSRLRADMQANGDPCHLLPLEALQHPEGRPGDRAAVSSLLSLLGVKGAPPAAAWPLVEPPASSGPAELKAALSWLPTLDEGEAFLRAQVSYPYQPTSAAVDDLQPVLREHESTRLSGLALSPVDAPAGRRLVVEQGAVSHAARWGVSSPGGPARFPGRPDAGQARFSPVVVRTHPQLPVRLKLYPGPDAAGLELAVVEFQPLNQRRIEGLFLGPWRIAFKPLAGVASATLCAALYRLMNAHLGLPEPRLSSDTERETHYRSVCCDISGAPFKFAVLRDPIERFTTLLRRQVAGPGLHAPGLPTAPSLATLIENFDAYMRQPELQAVFESQARQLVVPQEFSRLYRLDDMATLQRDLRQHTGRDVSVPPRPPQPLLQRMGLGRSKLPTDLARWITQRYADDVALWEQLA